MSPKFCVKLFVTYNLLIYMSIVKGSLETLMLDAALSVLPPTLVFHHPAAQMHYARYISIFKLYPYISAT